MLAGEDWARASCKDRMTRAQDYGKFVASLNAALTQDAIDRLNTNNDNGERMEMQTPYNRQFATPIHRRTNQTRRPVMFRKPFQKPHNANEFERLRAEAQCFKCKRLGTGMLSAQTRP